MKIQIIPTGQAPDKYNFNGETVTALAGEQQEVFDLSIIEEGGEFQGVELDTLELPPTQVIRNAERKDGDLYVTLCQQSGSGHWRKSDWIDAGDYNPQKTYIKKLEEDTDGTDQV